MIDRRISIRPLLVAIRPRKMYGLEQKEKLNAEFERR